MYRKILVTVENSDTDEVILAHIEPLLDLLKPEVVLLHVADGWAARNFDALKLNESEEMKTDREYLEVVRERLAHRSPNVQTILRYGSPSDEILKVAREESVDLVAMSTHGHRLLQDVMHGTTVDKVRHQLEVPLLLLKAPKK